jgi:hypothetical protein
LHGLDVIVILREQAAKVPEYLDLSLRVAGGITEFSRIIDRICCSCAFFLIDLDISKIFDGSWACAFFS